MQVATHLKMEGNRKGERGGLGRREKGRKEAKFGARLALCCVLDTTHTTDNSRD